MSVEIKRQIVEAARLMYSKNLVNAYEGNISCIDGEKVYITPSGICKGILTEEMIVVTDMEGNKIEGDYKPSSEVRMHIAAYKSRPDIKSVVHAHTPYATAFAIANKPIETKAYPEVIVLFDKVPLAEYGRMSTDEIFEGAKKYINDYEVILLANHGIMAIGNSALDAFFKVEAAESIAKTLLLTRLLGGEKDLTPQQLEELYEMRKKHKAK